MPTSLLGQLSSLAAAAAAALSIGSSVQAAPFGAPDLALTSACAMNGPQSILCTTTVRNVGTAPSGNPINLTDAISGAPANGQFTGGGGTLPISCTPGAGPILPISCHANISLAPGQAGTALFSFHLPTGGSLTSCATTTSAGDVQPSNNTNICASASVPGPSNGGPDLAVTKTCTVNGPQSVLCTVTVANVGTAPSSSPITLTDVVTGAPANGQFTGGGGTLPISCTPGAGPILPINCHANASILPGQSRTALFSFHLPTGGAFNNCATASSSGDIQPANNTSCTSVIVPPPGGCTGYPMVANVSFYNPMMPFGPQTVDICRGGHVTFHNVSSGMALVIQDLTSPGGQPLFPVVLLAAANGSTASTAPLQMGSPATYEYKISGFVVHGHINVH